MQYKCPQCSGTMLSLRTIRKSGRESKNIGWIYCEKCKFVIYLENPPEHNIYMKDPKGLAKLASYYREREKAERGTGKLRDSNTQSIRRYTKTQITS